MARHVGHAGFSWSRTVRVKNNISTNFSGFLTIFAGFHPMLDPPRAARHFAAWQIGFCP
jgi:hypothetical protein